MTEDEMDIFTITDYEKYYWGFSADLYFEDGSPTAQDNLNLDAPSGEEGNGFSFSLNLGVLFLGAGVVLGAVIVWRKMQSSKLANRPHDHM